MDPDLSVGRVKNFMGRDKYGLIVGLHTSRFSRDKNSETRDQIEAKIFFLFF